MLQIFDHQPKEHHFAAIIEAFCRLRQFKEAVLVLDLMNSSNIIPDSGTTRPFVDHLKQDPESIDATWSAIEDLHKDGRRLDIVVPRAVIIAAIFQKNLSKALAFYKALPGFNLSPDLDIFNQLLQGCVQAADRQLGDTVLTDLQANKIKPNQDTYQNFIYLCLTQSNYEDAFFYLEEMKAAGFKPSPSVYIALVDKCFESNDLRYQIALEEMEECGYSIPTHYREVREAQN
jgi:pentatricopeptide repeat protein